jgi:hypothetical protein
MQRMKCPVSRKEECSEECQAGRPTDIFLSFSIVFIYYSLTIGNTEEEIEEHKELTIKEHRNAISKKPKPKFDTTKQLNKNKQQQQSNQSTIKTDL